MKKPEHEMAQLSAWPKDVSGAKGDDIFDGYREAIKAWGSLCLEDNSGLTAFAYLWRRFGPPFLGSDDHKDLCGYVLTTNDPGVLLWITPSGSNLALAIGYLASKGISKEHEAPRMAWLKKFDALFEKWWVSQHPEFKGKLYGKKMKRARELFWIDRYNPEVLEKAEPFTKKLGRFNRREPTAARHRVLRATRWAMRELLRPVYVRDVSLNIFGTFPRALVTAKQMMGLDGLPLPPKVPNSPMGKMAEHSPYAGYPMPKDALDAMLKEK